MPLHIGGVVVGWCFARQHQQQRVRVEVVRRRGVVVRQLGASEGVISLAARSAQPVQPTGRAVRLSLPPRLLIERVAIVGEGELDLGRAAPRGALQPQPAAQLQCFRV